MPLSDWAPHFFVGKASVLANGPWLVRDGVRTRLVILSFENEEIGVFLFRENADLECPDMVEGKLFLKSQMKECIEEFSRRILQCVQIWRPCD